MIRPDAVKAKEETSSNILLGPRGSKYLWISDTSFISPDALILLAEKEKSLMTSFSFAVFRISTTPMFAFAVRKPPNTRIRYQEHERPYELKIRLSSIVQSIAKLGFSHSPFKT